ncbi:hypothetical protein ONS95_004067 [Cadophora gregata]|uniref:uncharacterized protein n=1 Tax=Cadophora gregata TaxID=51156 RepID=UPI0026DCAB18|nr:uncharacterized protein ONS95_004067 [Cadophora gregata]KAK0107374.1 hypothetical protein ONS95_004067 [Cadophora gregata]
MVPHTLTGIYVGNQKRAGLDVGFRFLSAELIDDRRRIRLAVMHCHALLHGTGTVSFQTSHAHAAFQDAPALCIAKRQDKTRRDETRVSSISREKASRASVEARPNSVVPFLLSAQPHSEFHPTIRPRLQLPSVNMSRELVLVRASRTGSNL